MRAARRSRPKSDQSQAKKSNAKPQKTGKAQDRANAAGPTQTNRVTASVSDREKPDSGKIVAKAGDDQEPAELSIKPIDERRPEQGLNKESARQRAAENIDKIGQALMKYFEQNRGYPRTYSETSSGIATLSWRVELLPYLGYEDLYQRFDLNVPWNREPNKSLLKYIPPEYVSPERFDTNTNYLLPSNRKFMFGENKSRGAHRIEDGVENTIMLLEVNDEMAVPWTKPADFTRGGLSSIREGLGGLRGDGTFAVWANGWTVLLANELSDKQIYDALTFESGDGQKAGAIHRDIAVGNVSEASTASLPKSVDVTAETPKAAAVRPKQVEVVRVREPVPKAADVAAAQKKLKVIYADKIREARDDQRKVRLADELLADALAMENDHSGAYALQSAAMRLANEGGNPSTLIKAVDQRVGIFDVDAYEENIDAILAFGQAAVSRDPESVKGGDELLKRSVRVIYAGIDDNDFMRASAVARIAYRYTGQERREVIPKLINRLRLLLATSKREYDSAVDDLQRYREDPENVEAGASFGRFLCFIKGDWDNGLPLLTKGGPQQLQEIAALDLNGGRSRLDIMALGDAWWELSDQARSGVYRQAARDRAVFWYKQAYESLPESLDRMHVKSRLDEAKDMDGTSPIALCIQLANELGVSLEYGLAAVADVGQTTKRKRNLR
ncbi:MAG: DUF1559 domain-containing protein [Pirellulales bacterium]|nr:DUF1559 domain-containing protein [Pirellulales bacterium]